MTTVAIMQPTYLPWLGYMALMDRVDTFVFLDCVAFDRRSWQQRNRIKAVNGPQMLTIPVYKKGLRDQRILDVQISHDMGFPEKHIRSIEVAYGKTPFFERYAGELFSRLRCPRELLAELTIDLIDWIAGELGIETERSRSSNMEIAGRKADRLVDICRQHGADRYLSPPGSRAYLEHNDAFERAGISVVYSDYDHPTYPQLHGPFISHLSVVDLMFNMGPNSLEIIRRGIR